jgi:hypothetical protein
VNDQVWSNTLSIVLTFIMVPLTAGLFYLLNGLVAFIYVLAIFIITVIGPFLLQYIMQYKEYVSLSLFAPPW